MKTKLSAGSLRWLCLGLSGCLALCACASPSIERLNLPGRSDGLPFSHAVRVGNTLYVAGTLGIDPETGQPPATIDAEVRLMLEGFRKKLALADMTMDDLVMVQVFCPDLELYAEFNAIYSAYFDQDFPVRAFIGSGPILRGCHFEINGIAAR